MNKKDYLKNNIEQVKQDWKKEHNLNKVSKKYGCSPSTLSRFLASEGIYRKNTKERQIKYIYLNSHKEDFKKDYVENILSMVELENKYLAPETALNSLARELDIKRKTKREKVNINELYKDYFILPLDDLSKKYGMSASCIYNTFEFYGLNKKDNIKRKYVLNENYFEKIDTQNKAYFLGFIYADGCVNEIKHTLTITLKKEDEYILQDFLKELQSNKQIVYNFNKKYNRYYPSVCIASKKLIKDLINLGVIQNKSYKILFPDNLIPKELLSHFIRGYFDGDGSITVGDNYKKGVISFTSNKNFLEGMSNFLYEELGVKLNIYNIKNKQICTASKQGTIQVPIILNYIYKDAILFLKRKYNKFLKYKEEIEKNEKRKN